MSKVRRPLRRPKRPRPPKRPPHVPPKPDTPKIPKPRPKPFRPRPRKPLPNELVRYLGANPTIASAIKWSSQASPNWQPYPTWSSAQKAQLADVYWQIRRGQFAGLSATPPMMYFSTGIWEGTPAGVGMGVDEGTSWTYFLAHIAHALVVEIARLVPWTLANYSSDQLGRLLTTEGLFEYHPAANMHLVLSGATPGDPVRIFRFMTTNGFIAMNRRDSIARLIDWCRANMRHFLGWLDPAGAQAHWQYNGYPPVERVISGTTHPQYGFAHWTGGCWGTTAFLRHVLRSANVPVERVSADGHATPRFMSENLYLSHGDDPYDRSWVTTPPVAAAELFIDQTTFVNWFGPNVPAAAQQDNVARRCTELALQYLSDWILQLRCRDLQQGVTNEAMSAVYRDTSLQLYKFYTVMQLQAMNLWPRLDAKLAAGGGCGTLFPSGITASITSPAAGSAVFGAVVVAMSASGQTAGVNTFRLEINGNVLSNQSIAGITASYTWDTRNWQNGFSTLVLKVTNAAGDLATASVTVTIANVITAAITTPAAGSMVSGTVPVTMTVSGQTLAFNIFRLEIDGMQVTNQTVAGLTATYNWDSTLVGNGPHTLGVTVLDAASKMATASISVDVVN